MSNNKLDLPDQKILALRVAARSALQGPVVGDYVLFESGQLERFSHDWGDGLQTSSGGSFYLCATGVASLSGPLNPFIPLKTITPSEATLLGSFWFFHHDIAGAHRGVFFDIPCRVFLTTAKYEGYLPATFKEPDYLALKAELHRQLGNVDMEQANA